MCKLANGDAEILVAFALIVPELLELLKGDVDLPLILALPWVLELVNGDVGPILITAKGDACRKQNSSSPQLGSKLFDSSNNSSRP